MQFFYIPLFLLSSFSFSQKKIPVGIWEKFDIRQIPKENLLINSKEIKDAIDNDNNGYIDDIVGIGFDEFENLKPEEFLSDTNNHQYYEHGTIVAELMLKKNPNISLCGVGFEYTSDRLKKAGLLGLSYEERQLQFPKELEKMKFFVDSSIDFFVRKKVKIVNISWGIDLEHIIEINPNFGGTYLNQKEMATKWLTAFRGFLTDSFRKNSSIIFVVSAGNSGQDIETAFDVPALIDLPNVIVVGALSKDEKGVASFSNFGKNVTVFAPGEGIIIKTIDRKEIEEDGTSLSAPFVSATVAKLIEEKKTIKEIKQQLLKIKNLRSN